MNKSIARYTTGPQCQIPGLPKMLELLLGGVISDGTFVEVGAFDCKQWSNTYGLAMMGWTGIFFEPSAELVGKCEQNMKGLDNIEIVRAALSDWEGETDLFLGGSLSTIREDSRDLYMSMGWSSVTGLGTGKTEKVPVSTLDKQLHARDWKRGFELLVIDVEGSEVDVLVGFDISVWMPRVAIIETHEKFENAELAEKSAFIDGYMSAAGYTKFYSDHINTIYSLEGHKWTPTTS